MRALPSVDEVLSTLKDAPFPRALLVEGARMALERRREKLLSLSAEEGPSSEPLPERRKILAEIAIEAEERARDSLRSSMCGVINATGVILHTNLGRAPLSEDALRGMVEVSGSYSTLEYDLTEGRRGKRGGSVEEFLKRLTGTEAALVVNNNAAAVHLALKALAEGREVIVSRGELVEIGGSFRVPDVMAASGAILREVGTTNKTHLQDYARAIGPETALILKVHTSNYRILGFTSEVSVGEVSRLGKERGLPLMVDLGSGCLLRLEQWGLPHEPMPGEALAAGASLVTFSGDKLLGGPQAGIAVGGEKWIALMKKHPVMRVVRPDKVALVALERTLMAYLEPDGAVEKIPALAMLLAPYSKVRARGRRLMRRLPPEVREALGAELIDCESEAGGGSLPLAKLPSRALALRPRDISLRELEERLRLGEPPVVSRIQEERLILDMRTVRDRELPHLAGALKKVPGACR